MKYLFLLLPLFVLCQNQTAKGLILDKKTNEPIPYVNISILESQIGTSSHEDGSYSLEINKEDLNKVVKLSSLGYEVSKMPISLFLKSGEVFLQPLVEQLDEVVISEKFEEKTLIVNELNEDDLCQGYGSSAQNPWLLSLYFPFYDDYEDVDFIKSVRLHFGNFKNKKAKFRLRLFSIGKDSLPDKDLLKENIIVSLKKKQKIVDVDISDYSIIFPREGFYVAFEWLYIPYNEEEVTFHFGKNNKKKEKRIKYNPTLSGTCEEEGRFKVAIYNSGEWRFYAANKYKGKEKVIPAISVTLSN